MRYDLYHIRKKKKIMLEKERRKGVVKFNRRDILPVYLYNNLKTLT